MEKPLQVFCCYARKDQEYLHQLKNHLMTLQRENLIETKADINISPGIEWEREIGRHLEEADIILLLISSDFIASDYCFDKEMQQAIARHTQGTARVVPVIIRPTAWENMPFSKLQALPKNVRPVTSWQNRDDAWIDVVRGIRDVAYELLKNHSMSHSRMHNQQLPEPESVVQQRALDNVEKLVPEVDISLYQDAFGKPTFINHQPFSTNPNYERKICRIRFC